MIYGIRYYMLHVIVIVLIIPIIIYVLWCL